MLYVLCFLALFIGTNPTFQQIVARSMNTEQPTVVSGFVSAFLLCLMLILCYYLYQSDNHTNEPFLFQVSKFSPRCSGLYVGKPTTFQYDQIGCNYNKPVGGNPDMIQLTGPSGDHSIKGYCTPEADPPLGYIGNKDAQRYDGDPKLFPNYGDTN